MEIKADNPTGTILVVDDDEGVRRLLGRWVTDLGHSVKIAPDADAALKIMHDCPIDVALCDIRMPGHDGFWLLDQVRRLFPKIAVVLATGLVEMDPMVTLRPGVAGYIVKPFNRDELDKVVKRGLKEHGRLEMEQPSGPRLLSPGILDGIILSQE